MFHCSLKFDAGYYRNNELHQHKNLSAYKSKLLKKTAFLVDYVQILAYTAFF